MSATETGTETLCKRRAVGGLALPDDNDTPAEPLQATAVASVARDVPVELL